VTTVGGFPLAGGFVELEECGLGHLVCSSKFVDKGIIHRLLFLYTSRV
jgi:hypothetical protein